MLLMGPEFGASSKGGDLTCQRQNRLLLVWYVVGCNGVLIGTAGATRHSIYINWATIMHGVAIGVAIGSLTDLTPTRGWGAGGGCCCLTLGLVRYMGER